jgi:cell division protein FtsB
VRLGITGGAPDSLRGGRAHRMALATSGLFGVSSTRRAAILALVVCALALTVAVPLRNFLTQRQELSALQAKQHQLASEVDELTRRRNELVDPAHVQSEARDRLGYVRPGEIPYVVQLPGDAASAGAGVTEANPTPWFQVLWSELRGVQR